MDNIILDSLVFEASEIKMKINLICSEDEFRHIENIASSEINHTPFSIQGGNIVGVIRIYNYEAAPSRQYKGKYDVEISALLKS